MRIERGSAVDLDALEPLWLSVHHAHQAANPELAPYVSDEESWAERRKIYGSLCEKPDTFLLLARTDGGELVGYALVHVVTAEEAEYSDTWQTGQQIAELESIAVDPLHRGQGLGTALLDAVDDELASRGLHDVIIGVLPGNTRAIDLYARRGFKPTWLYLSRLAGR